MRNPSLVPLGLAEIRTINYRKQLTTGIEDRDSYNAPKGTRGSIPTTSLYGFDAALWANAHPAFAVTVTGGGEVPRNVI